MWNGRRRRPDRISVLSEAAPYPHRLQRHGAFRGGGRAWFVQAEWIQGYRAGEHSHDVMPAEQFREE